MPTKTASSHGAEYLEDSALQQLLLWRSSLHTVFHFRTQVTQHLQQPQSHFWSNQLPAMLTKAL